ncbi:MAG: hypothetical protein ACM3YO_08705 [Bacteroidota bacterium]
MKRLLLALLLAGCSTPPLALNSDANLPKRPAVEQALGSDFTLGPVPMQALSENQRFPVRILRFAGVPYALVNEGGALKILRYQNGWQTCHQGLPLPGDSFLDEQTIQRKETAVQADLYGDLAIVNDRLVLVCYKASLSIQGDQYNTLVYTLDPAVGTWKSAFNAEGKVHLLNRDHFVEKTNADPGDAYFWRQDGETVFLFTFDLFQGGKTILGEFRCAEPLGQAYLCGNDFVLVSSQNFALIRFHLGSTEAPEAWKIGDHTDAVPQEGVESRILAVSEGTVFFLYEKDRPSIGTFQLATNQVSLCEEANAKLLLSPDSLDGFLSVLSDHRLYLASPQGVFFFDTRNPRLLFSFGGFQPSKSQLLLCGADRVHGSLAVATLNSDSSMALFASRP